MKVLTRILVALSLTPALLWAKTSADLKKDIDSAIPLACSAPAPGDAEADQLKAAATKMVLTRIKQLNDLLDAEITVAKADLALKPGYLRIVVDKLTADK